uniref:Uncharacterized protein n=1 Tax=Cannabis sativa TaxID=3483 RepID=A0A803QUC6_CANSA
MLASWKRLNYPHIAIGALASSAPILQFEDIAHVETFYDLISNGFKVSQPLFTILFFVFYFMPVNTFVILQVMLSISKIACFFFLLCILPFDVILCSVS